MILKSLLVLLVLLTGCSANEEQKDETIIFYDSREEGVELDVNPERVISLIASTTDLWLNAGGEVIATSEESYNQGLVDESIQLVSKGKEVNVEAIVALNPDLVILSEDYPSHTKLAEVLDDANIDNILIKLDDFEDYYTMLEVFTQLTNRPDLFEKHGVQQADKIKTYVEQASTKPVQDILLLRAYSSGISAKVSDNFVGGMLDSLNTHNIANDATILLDELNLEVILDKDPDKIFITTMGKNADATMEYLEANLMSHPIYQNLSAVKNNQVYILEQELFHYRPNEQWALAYEKLFNHLY